MRISISRSRAALLLVGAFLSITITSTGCGKGELEEANRVLQTQLDMTKAAKEAAEKLAAMREGKIKMDAKTIADLEKQIMSALCAPMLPMDPSKVFECHQPGKNTQIGTWSIRDDLSALQGKCVMDLKVDGKGVMSCKAQDLSSAVEFRCNAFVCRDQAAQAFPPT